jgi:hypothetical protein
MSLLDVIRDQQMIILSVAIALLPLLIAGGLALRSALRHQRAQRLLRQQERATLLALQAAAEATAAPVKGAPAANGRVQPAAAAKTAAGASATPAAPPNTAPTVVKGVPAASPGAAPAVAGTATEGQAAAPESAVSSAMKDILSSVFVDEGAEARYEALLAGLEPVDVHELAALCNQVATQMGVDVKQLAAKPVNQ